MVITGTITFQVVMALLARTRYRTPNRLATTNRAIITVATT